jgi:hypothetical protein
VPAQVLSRPLAPDATDDDRARARDELIRAVGGSKIVIDLATPPVADPALTDREIVFRSGELVSRLPAATAAMLDVRDKDELAALRGARRRDVILWRVAIGCAAALVLLGALEFARLGGLEWQKVRLAKVKAQQPRVEAIVASNSLAIRIEDLATKRLLPLEMLTVIMGENREIIPPNMKFTRVQADTTRGIYTLVVEGQTNNAGEISLYQAALEKLPACEKVEIQPLPGRGDLAPFRLVVTFKRDAIKPDAAS